MDDNGIAEGFLERESDTRRLNIICRCLYKLYAPDALKQRRNINRCKISDSSILALLIWQASLGVESQRRFCEKLVNLSHSRFNRRARMLLPLIYLIRHGLNEEVDLSGDILIIDSFPVPVCQRWLTWGYLEG